MASLGNEIKKRNHHNNAESEGSSGKKPGNLM
jgi:hypothetical protein